MYPTNNYYFIDGSALLAQIRSLQKAEKAFLGRRLDVMTLVHTANWLLNELGMDYYRRAILYFPSTNDPLLKADLAELVQLPNRLDPGKVRDFELKSCGKRLPKA